MLPMSPECLDLLRQAWTQHQRDPHQLLPLGQQLVACSEALGGGEGIGWGWLQQGWGHRFLGELEAAAQALTQAQSAFRQLDSASGLAACRDLEATLLGLQRRWAEALALLQLNTDAPRGPFGAYERFSTHWRRAWLLDVLGRRDDALRERYALLAAARETGDDGPLAYALGLLGGTHADLFNLEEADRLCAEGMRRAKGCGARQAWVLASLNRMNALLALDRAAEALKLAEALQAQESVMNPRAREQRCIVYADAHAQAGQYARAQALLDESQALRHAGSESLLSWTVAQVGTWLAQQRWRDARELAEGWLANPQHGTDPAAVPGELLRLLRMVSRACQELEDLASALRWQRRAFEVHESLVGRSARAARLAFEIEYELDRERWQRAQAEQEQARLDALNRQLGAANAAKTRFLAAASHDLRQPVQALNLSLAVLSMEPMNADQGQLVHRMERSLNALTTMFDGLLDISKLDAGIVPAYHQRVNLRPLLQRLRDEAAAQLQGRDLQVRLRMPAEPCEAQSDPALLERILRNLLDNAIKYTESGGLVLALRPMEQGWRIQVQDTGIGMSAEVLTQATDEFFQANNPERDRGRGLGLGLSIVSRLADLLGHRLSIRSKLGYGTKVEIELALAALELTPLAVPCDRPQPLPRCVAVLDDDADVRESLSDLLRRWGHTVLAARSCGELLEQWHLGGQRPVDAVLSDLRLPAQESGIEAVVRLRGCWGSELPALLVTGDTSPDALVQVRASGLPWLAKPVMPMRLRSWLAQNPN